MIRGMKSPPKAHEVLQELRDLSSMAMEHFDEKILPDLKHSLCSSLSSNIMNSYDLPTTSLSTSHHSSTHSLPSISQTFTTDKLDTIFKKIYNQMRKNKALVIKTKTQMNKLKQVSKKQNYKIQLQYKLIVDQHKKIKSQETQLADMKKHMEEWEQKLGDLTAKVSRAHEETDNCPDDRLKNHERKCLNLPAMKDIRAKKRKLIVERQSSNNAKDIKFKKFMSDLLRTNDETTGY